MQEFTRVHENTFDKRWYISSSKGCWLPFGMVFASFFNQLISFQDKKSFIANEKFFRKSSNTEQIFDGLFSFRLYIAASVGNVNYTATQSLSDDELEDLYQKCTWINKYLGDKISALSNWLEKFNDLPKNNRLKYVSEAYNHVRFLVSLIINLCVLQRDGVAIDNKICQENIDLCSRPGYCLDRTLNMFQYVGIENVSTTDNTIYPCNTYIIPGSLDALSFYMLVVEDSKHFLLGDSGYTTTSCHECGKLFIAQTAKQKYCPTCSQSMPEILQRKRKENKERYQHKKINDYIKNILGDWDASANFLAASNAFWEKVKNHEKTKEQYMRWLIKQEKIYKSRKD